MKPEPPTLITSPTIILGVPENILAFDQQKHKTLLFNFQDFFILSDTSLKLNNQNLIRAK